MVLYSNHYKEILSGSTLPVNAMTEQQKLTFPMLLQQLDSLMLRDKQRFARRLHGVKKVKILMHNRPFSRDGERD